MIVVVDFAKPKGEVPAGLKEVHTVGTGEDQRGLLATFCWHKPVGGTQLVVF